MSATRLDSELLQHANLHFVYICFPTRGIMYESHEATPPPLLLHTAVFDVYLRFIDIDVELSRQIQHRTSSSPWRHTCRVWSRSDELPSRCVSNRRTDLLFHNLMKERDEEDLIWDVLIIILMLCSQVNAAFFTLHSVSIQVVSFLQETEKPCNPPAFSSSSSSSSDLLLLDFIQHLGMCRLFLNSSANLTACRITASEREVVSVWFLVVRAVNI